MLQSFANTYNRLKNENGVIIHNLTQGGKEFDWLLSTEKPMNLFKINVIVTIFQNTHFSKVY